MSPSPDRFLNESPTPYLPEHSSSELPAAARPLLNESPTPYLPEHSSSESPTAARHFPDRFSNESPTSLLPEHSSSELPTTARPLLNESPTSSLLSPDRSFSNASPTPCPTPERSAYASSKSSPGGCAFETPCRSPNPSFGDDDFESDDDDDEDESMESEDEADLMTIYFSAHDLLAQRSGYLRQRGVGFQNMGNTCFMNATLQAIINTPGIREHFTRDAFMEYVNKNNKLGTKGIFSAVFSSLVDLYVYGGFTVITPYVLLDAFSYLVNPCFSDGKQHDAQEFQTYLLDALHEDTNRVQIKRPFEQNYDGTDMVGHANDYALKLLHFSSSPIADLFNFRTVSELICSTCYTTSVTFEDQAQISLELKDNIARYVQLDDCLHNHFKPESLKNDSRWNCPKCKQPRNATRETKIWKMPKTLVIHLKRFSEYDGGYIKNDMHVDFDQEDLRLDKYLHDDAPQKKISYSLYAITNHFGTMNAGHYTSYIRSEDFPWLNYDDEYVSEPLRYVNNEAMVLFYTAKND